MIYNNTSLAHQNNFVAAIASYLQVFNMHSMKETQLRMCWSYF